MSDYERERLLAGALLVMYADKLLNGPADQEARAHIVKGLEMMGLSMYNRTNILDVCKKLADFDVVHNVMES